MRITREDAFRILGVNEESSADEIRSCYKKLALRWHPDKHGDSNVTKDEATLKFQEVSAAYKRLTTNMNDADDEIDDNEFMNIREMMELFAHIFFHNGVRGCPHHGMDCCDYDDDEYFYSDDEYYDYTDEESEDEFLDTITHRLRNKYEQRKYKAKDKAQTQRHNITEEEALRNARELIEEEEQEKKREEKKKAKRKKKKEKKKQKDKEKKEQEVIVDKNEKSNKDNKSNKENNNPGEEKIADEKPATQPTDTNKQDNNNTSGKKSKANESNKKNSKNKQSGGVKKDNSKIKNNKNTEGGPDEEIIDTHSAFFAHAASKAPHLNSTSSENTKENSKKKKSSPTQHKDNTTNINTKKKNAPPLSTTSSISTTSSVNNTTTTTTTQQQQQQENHHKPPAPPTKKSSSSSSSEKNSSSSIPPVKNKNPTIIQANTEQHKTPPPPLLTNGIHKSDDLILKSRQVAVQGNQMAQLNDYTGAVKMFTQAIDLDPTDFRFFGNRSYCFDRLENYKKALDDANAAIELSPEWPKGFFRKGRALTGLNRFQEAEQVFQQVLKLDPGCEDAQFELARVRVQILIDMGFNQSMSEQAVRTYSTVQQALEALLAGKVSDEEGSDDVYFSEEEEIEEGPPPSPTYRTVQSHNKKQSNKPKAPPQPKCTALWVGNVDPQLVTEKQMSQLFNKCGKVSSVRILPHKYCAFVNYAEPSSAVMAMEKLQGAGLGSQKLLLRFPNNPPPGSFVPEQPTINTTKPTPQPPQPPQPTVPQQQQKTSPSISESSNDSSKVSGPVNGDECYFWRTTGCVFENQCRYKHVRGHKGVDLAKVQAKYGKLPSSS